MIEYIKRKISKIAKEPKSRNIDFSDYPIYYSKDGILIREEKDGNKFEIAISQTGKEQILRKL